MDCNFPYIKNKIKNVKRKKQWSEILRVGEGAVSLMFGNF